MHEDLTLACDSSEYGAVFDLASVLVLIFPVGIPIAYLLLLWASRDALRSKKPSSLSRATAFLSGDYVASAFWWEPLEMCRKLTLSISMATRTREPLHAAAV